MTDFTSNLRIPYLDQNVAQPEIPENTAKSIIDSFLTSVYTIDVTATDVTNGYINITHSDDPTKATSWQSFIFEVTDTGGLLTVPINIGFPVNPRPYILKNSTSFLLNFKTSTGSTLISIGGGKNGYAYSDGAEFKFLNLGAAESFLSLNDVTPNTFIGYEGWNTKVNAAGTGLEFVDQKDSTIWNGLWAEGTYIQGDMVRDGLYLMVCKVLSTIDRAGPQEFGPQSYLVDEATVFNTVSNTSVIRMTHNITLTKSGKVKEIKLKAPTVTADTFARLTISNINTGEVIIYDNVILQSGAWVLVSGADTLVKSGNQYILELELYNSATASTFTGVWDSNLGTGVPIAGEFNIDNLSTPTVIEMAYTDWDNLNRSTELDNVAVGSLIYISEAGSPNRNIEVKVTAIDPIGNSLTSNKYTVTTINNGSKDIRNGRKCSVKVDGPVTSTDYYSLAGEYTTNPPIFGSVTTALEYDGVDQGAATDVAYGVNITFQEMEISPDWDFMAIS